jgi:hypothetical protein
MKLLKSFLILCIAVSITSCSSDDENSFELTAENFVSVYALTDYESDITETATSSSGDVSTLSETEKEGDTYDTEVTLNADNTYTIDGSFRIGSKTDNETETFQTIILETTGTYSLNIISKTITLTETVTEEAVKGAGLVVGTFDIISFNENKLELEQTTTTAASVGTNSISTVTEVTLTRN